MADGSFQLVFRCLDVPELTEYADASADVRAVYDHAGAEELQTQEFRRPCTARSPTASFPPETA